MVDLELVLAPNGQEEEEASQIVSCSGSPEIFVLKSGEEEGLSATFLFLGLHIFELSFHLDVKF